MVANFATPYNNQKTINIKPKASKIDTYFIYTESSRTQSFSDFNLNFGNEYCSLNKWRQMNITSWMKNNYFLL